jgi:hypothetical protein
MAVTNWCTAIVHPDAAIIEIFLQYGKPSAETLQRGLRELSLLPSTATKAAKLESMLRRTKQKENLGAMLPNEVQSLLKTPQEKRIMSILKSLLASGADVNTNNATALCLAVSAADTQITDLLFTTKPTPPSLAFALPHALRISDPMDRLTFTQKLLQAGAPPAEANRALGFAINAFSDDLPLISTLILNADLGDGEALGSAVKKENPDIVELVLRRRQHSVNMLNRVFADASKGKNREARIAICTSLLRAGATGKVVSDALLAAAGDGDLVLGQILMEHGGSIESNDGQAVVEACRSGSVDVLQMLLKGPREPKKATLERAFQAATEVRDLKKRAAVFKILLGKGVSGDVVDAQLVSAVRYGDEGQEVIGVLLEAGANPDYNNGEAVWAATRSAFVGNLNMMLGNVVVGERQVSDIVETDLLAGANGLAAQAIRRHTQPCDESQLEAEP